MSPIAGVKRFWQGVTEGLTLQQLWNEFQRDAGTSYRLYRKDVEGKYEARSRPRRWLRHAGALFWAMLRKLSPARRIFLLLALVLLLAGLQGEWRGAGLLGVIALLVLLGLELADRVALKRDLEIAREIQKWLVPQAPPRVAGVDIAFATRPANTVAGDYYDAFVCPGAGPAERLLLVVADVAGKGMPAALLMATFQSSLRTLVQESIPLAELVSRLNRYCCEHSLEGRRFTTAVLAEWNRASGHVTYVNAGHNPPALRRTDGAIEWLKAGGLPLGVQTGATYESGAASLSPGDLLMIYTDGVPEAGNAAGEHYGEARLTDLVRGLREGSAAAALSALMASVDAFVGNAGRQDDVTCLVARRTSG